LSAFEKEWKGEREREECVRVSAFEIQWEEERERERRVCVCVHVGEFEKEWNEERVRVRGTQRKREKEREERE
jgi:hypothetical protein